METIVLVAAAALVVVAVLVLRRPPDLGELTHAVRSLSERVTTDVSHLHQRLEGIEGRVSGAQSDNQALAQAIFGRLGSVEEATRTVAEQARQFTTLQDLLKPPKVRGGLGEALLEELLRQVLPPSAYSMQHRFRSGKVVDAVVRAGGRKVCIDSKFPLENYRRICEATDELERAKAEKAFAADVESHIRAVAAYIVPDEDTLDFAVMYIPAEGVYGEVLRLSHRNRPLFELALEARVVPMSPLNLYGYLQTVLFGLKCLKIEESAEAILDGVGRLHTDLERFVEDHDTLGRHITNAHSKFADTSRRLERLRSGVERMMDLEGSDEAAELRAVASD